MKPSKGQIWSIAKRVPISQRRRNPLLPESQLATVLGIKPACGDGWWAELMYADGTFFNMPDYQWNQWITRDLAKLEVDNV